ncbi:unnamed protein product [Rotaria sp. Silwood1]|nr:unnamed protein product [Rotaria sp. Silwood1]
MTIRFHLAFVVAIPNIPVNARWRQNGITVAGGHGRGDATNQLYWPAGLFVDDDQTIIIADSWNHRVVRWKIGDANGQVIAGGHGKGNRLDQLNQPTDVLIDKETDSLIICDRDNIRVVRWSRRSGTTQGEILVDNIQGWGLTMDDQRCLYISDPGNHKVKRHQIEKNDDIVVAGGNGQGANVNQLNDPLYIFVDRQQAVYVSDNENHRVMKWSNGAKEIVAGGQGKGNALTQLSCPHGLFVDMLGTLYVADSLNHRVMRWPKGAKEGTVIVGGNGLGEGANQLNKPMDKILSKFHSLSNLHYLNIYATLIQSPYITARLFSIRSLKRLILHSFDPILLHLTDNAICSWTKLEYLELNSCYMIHFLELLKYIGPNVKRMAITILYKRREDPASIDPAIIDNLLYGDGGHPQIPVSLNRLYMSFHYLSLTDFQLVLKLFPNLRHLTFSTSTFDLNFASSTIWHEFISTNLTKLEKFQFYIRITGSAIQQCPSPELVHSYNSNHYKWIDGPVIMDYNHVLEPPTLEVYTYSQSAHNRKYAVEFYGKQRYMKTTSNTIDVDKNITKLKITLHDNVEQLVLTNQSRTIYPNVTIITIHSQMTTRPKENDPISRCDK